MITVPSHQQMHIRALRVSINDAIKHSRRLVATEITECMRERLEANTRDLERLHATLSAYDKALQVATLEQQLEALREEVADA